MLSLELLNLAPEIEEKEKPINVFEISQRVEEKSHHLNGKLLEFLDPEEEVRGKEEDIANMILLEAETMFAQGMEPLERSRKAKNVLKYSYFLEYLSPEMPDTAREKLHRSREITNEECNSYCNKVLRHLALGEYANLTTYDYRFIFAFKNLYPGNFESFRREYASLNPPILPSKIGISEGLFAEELPLLYFSFPETKESITGRLIGWENLIKESVYELESNIITHLDLLLAAKLAGIDIDIGRVPELIEKLQNVHGLSRYTSKRSE